MTLEEEFQKPVRDRLAEIVIPEEPPSYKDWPQHIVPVTDYDQWTRQAQSYQDTQMKLHNNKMDEITHAPDVGVLSGQFPSPTPRKRKRKRKPRAWAGDDKL